MQNRSLSIILVLLLVPFSVTADGLTKELLFKGLRKEMMSRIVTEDFIRNPSMPQEIELGNYYELETESGRINSSGSVSKVLKNSYNTNLHPDVCGETTYGNNVMFFFAKLDGIHKFYTAKYFCEVFKSGCSLPDPSIMLTHDEVKMKTIEDDCPGLAKLYKDYEVFADITIKKLYEYAKKKVEAKRKEQQEVQLAKQKRQEELDRKDEERRQKKIELIRKRKEKARQLALKRKQRLERDRIEMARIQRKDAERAKKKREEEARKRRKRKQALKAGEIPIKSVEDAALYYNAGDRLAGFNIILQTPLRPDNKYYIVGGVITGVSPAKNGQMFYSAQAGKKQSSGFHFMFFSKDTEINANLRRNHYTEFVGKFIKTNSRGEPIFIMYYCN